MQIGNHFKYARYLLKHKWYVMVECFKEGLVWRGITHDLSKFLPDEWLPYAAFFYGDQLVDIKAAFDLAWNRHQKRNDHHWQWWMLMLDRGGAGYLAMSYPAIVEMCCDWYGVSRTKNLGGWPAVVSWYEKNRRAMRMQPQTRKQTEIFILEKAGATEKEALATLERWKAEE